MCSSYYTCDTYPLETIENYLLKTLKRWFTKVLEAMNRILKKTILILLIVSGLFFLAQSSLASSAYVTDSFKVTLRTGPSTENKIITMLSSGQPVEVLESNSSWSRIRVQDKGSDKEGWILSRYLITRMPWKMQASSSQAVSAELKEKLPHIENELNITLRREKELTEKLQKNSDAFSKLQQEYESLEKGAAAYLELKKKHDAARKELGTTQQNLQRLIEENRILIHSKRNMWFLSGSLVLLFGLMIGLAIGKRQKKRGSSLYS
jgi:SH3 domain protein